MDGLDWQGAVKDIHASVNWLKANGSKKVLYLPWVFSLNLFSLSDLFLFYKLAQSRTCLAQIYFPSGAFGIYEPRKSYPLFLSTISYWFDRLALLAFAWEVPFLLQARFWSLRSMQLWLSMECHRRSLLILPRLRRQCRLTLGSLIILLAFQTLRYDYNFPLLAACYLPLECLFLSPPIYHAMTILFISINLMCNRVLDSVSPSLSPQVYWAMKHLEFVLLPFFYTFCWSIWAVRRCPYLSGSVELLAIHKYDEWLDP